jgi:hypothetical protein
MQVEHSCPSPSPVEPNGAPALARPKSTVAVGDLGLNRVLLLTIACYLVYLFTLSHLINYGEFVRGYGDNAPYVKISTAIEHWNFSHLEVKLFWGLPYAVAALSSVARASNLNTLIGISVVASLIAIAFAYKLWGGWVAVAFVILSREWLERSLLGGAEPLFLALLLGAFLAARKEKWAPAALLASLATVVRPMGIFALAGIALALLRRKDYRNLLWATAIGLVIGGLYVLPLKLHFGNSLANVRGYDQEDWNSQSPIGIPFVAIIRDALAGNITKLNLARCTLWIILILVSACAMLRATRLKDYGRRFPVELTFCALYFLFLFTYNSRFARIEFPRFAIPIIPFSIFALEKWIPRNYWLLFALGAAAAVLSAGETVGIVNAIGLVRKAL